MLHPLEHVGDHQNPLAHTPALASCQAPQLRRPRFAAKEVCRHRLSPQTWYTCLITLPHLGITGSRYKICFHLPDVLRSGSATGRSPIAASARSPRLPGYGIAGTTTPLSATAPRVAISIRRNHAKITR